MENKNEKTKMEINVNENGQSNQRIILIYWQIITDFEIDLRSEKIPKSYFLTVKV